MRRIAAVVLAGMTIVPALRSAAGAAEGSAQGGIVHDLDYLKPQKWNQVLIKGGPGAQPEGDEGRVDGIVAQTNDPGLQRVLETALLTGAQVRVTTDGKSRPAKILTVRLIARDPCAGDGCVLEIRCGPKNECAAKIQGQASEIPVKEPRVIGVLLTAIAFGKATGYLTVTEGEITRVKVDAGGTP